MAQGTSIDRAEVSAPAAEDTVLTGRSFSSWRIWGFVGIGLIVLAATAIHVRLTRGGIGLSPDSITYILIARGLDAGDGYGIRSIDGTVAAQSHWPPLYPLVLAGVLRVGGAIPEAVTWLNALLLAVVLGLAAALARRVGNGSIAAALVCTAVLASSTEMLAIHVMLISEPLFLSLLLASILVLDRALATQRMKWLVAAGVLMGLAWITRYAGVGTVIMGVLCTGLFWRSSGWRGRLLAGGVFAACSMTPTLLWIARGFTQTGAVGNRAIVWHPPDSAALQSLYDTIAGWVFPGRMLAPERVFWIALLVVGLIAAAWWCVRRSKVSAASGTANLLVIFACGYFAFLMLSLTWFDAYTPLDFRTLAPVQALATPLVCGAFVAYVGRPTVRPVFCGLIAVIAIAAVAIRVSPAADWVERAPAESLGYNSTGWRESTLMEAIRQLPTQPWIYSNRADAIVACTGRLAIQLPRRSDPTQLRPNPDLPDDLAKISEHLEQRWAYVVMVRRKGPQFLIDETELRTLGRLRVVGRYAQGTIYRLSAVPESSPTSAPTAE